MAEKDGKLPSGDHYDKATENRPYPHQGPTPALKAPETLSLKKQIR